MISFKNINLTFDKRIIFTDYSLDIKQSEKILLVAPSGKGKSSLAKMMLGFLKPSDGEILINNRKVNEYNIKKIRENISYVSQDVDLPNEKVSELFNTIFSYNVNKHLQISSDQISELIIFFQLDLDILRKNINELSGGERQRIGLIICILLNRDIWILDEITSALDNELKQKTCEKLLDNEKTIIVISHDPQWKSHPKFKCVYL